MTPEDLVVLDRMRLVRLLLPWLERLRRAIADGDTGEATMLLTVIRDMLMRV